MQLLRHVWHNYVKVYDVNFPDLRHGNVLYKEGDAGCAFGVFEGKEKYASVINRREWRQGVKSPNDCGTTAIHIISFESFKLPKFWWNAGDKAINDYHRFCPPYLWLVMQFCSAFSRLFQVYWSCSSSEGYESICEYFELKACVIFSLGVSPVYVYPDGPPNIFIIWVQALRP